MHVPLTADTHHLISDRELALMKPTGILINTARGSVLDPKALYAALRDGQILAAGLDVTDPEPIPLDDPAAEPGQLSDRASYRQRQRRHAHENGGDGGGQCDRRPARRKAADLR